MEPVLPAQNTDAITSTPRTALIPNRITSVDVYRGFVMLLMIGEVLSFEKVSQTLPNSTFWQIVSFNQSHVPWYG